jgi:integrase
MSSSTIRFTKVSVARLACPQGRAEAFFWDGELPGFGIRAYSSGKRHWIVQYRNAQGRTQRKTLGDLAAVTLDEARKQARHDLSRASLGADPQAERRAARKAVRLVAVVEDYLADMKAKLRARSYAEVERHVKRHVAPLHHHAASTICRADIVRLLSDLRDEKGPVAANRTRASLSALWTWALRSGRLEGENPVAHVPKPARETPRARVLTDAELALIWHCTDSGHDHDRIVRLLMLTGARRDEVGAMTWREVETDAGDGALWTLPAARSKNGLPHEVLLGLTAVSLLPARREANPAVFGETGGGFAGWSRCKARLDARMQKRLRQNFAEHHGRPPNETEPTLQPWVLHDLRRTVSTWMNENGVEPHVVEAVLNHVSGVARRGVAGTYNKALYRAQKAAALAAWEAHLRSLASLPSLASNVVPLRKAG